MSKFIVLRRFKNGPTSLIEVYPESKKEAATGCTYTIKNVIANNDPHMMFADAGDRFVWNTYNPETKKLGSPRMFIDINIGTLDTVLEFDDEEAARLYYEVECG